MRRFALACCLIIFPLCAHSTTYLSDHFDMGSDTNVPSGNASQITSESTGAWTMAGPTEGASIDILASARHGDTGRGLRFSWVNGAGATESGTLGRSDATTFWQTYPNSLWIGYWFKSSISTGGTPPNDHLKILRLYGGSSSIIPDIYYSTGEIIISIGGYPYSTGYYLSDTNWHCYIWQFTGASTDSGTDGSIRLWVDGSESPVYSKIDITFSGTRTQIGWNDINENLSGGWSGGEFTTSWDDFIIANTRDEVSAFLGAPSSGDTNPPTVTISTSDPQNISTDSVSISWTDSDDTGVTSRKWRIGAAPDATHGTECTSPATVTGLSVGANTVYIGAVDAAGNWGSDSITVIYTLPYTGTIPMRFMGPVKWQNTPASTWTPAPSGAAMQKDHHTKMQWRQQ